MKLRTIFLIAALSSVLGVRAQELTVKSMAAAPMDLSASKYERKDLTGKPCALVKVQLATTGALFEGNVIGKSDYKTGEYWVYMSEGSYMLSVKHPNYVPLSVNFRDYDISGVKGKATYILTLLMPQGGRQDDDDGMRYLVMAIEPKNATLVVDGRPQGLDDGEASVLLALGVHTYRVTAPGYAPEEGTVTMAGEKQQKSVRLRSVQASVTVSCPTPGAQIYRNDRLMGGSPWSGQLLPGDYVFEARRDGYRPQRQTVVLTESEQRRVDLSALEAITGSLNVNYRPTNAEVWVDGTKLGTSPDVFRNIVVGNHEVELRKSGYATKKEAVTIEEGKTAMLTGSLEAQSQPTAANNSGASAGETETFTVKGVSFNMVRVEGGTFRMGSDDIEAFSGEKPVHDVTLTSYSIGETEVTQELWETVMGNNPSEFKGAKRPVENVSWEECQEFIDKLNEKTGRKFRLPTEAEWEYAARGGKVSKNYKYSGSNNIDDVAVYDKNSYDKGRSSPDYGTHPVKSKQANELDLYDMSGNVWEWCQDWYDKDYYSSSPQTNPTGPSSGSYRVYRGGGWNFSARYCRSSIRHYITPSIRYSSLGLRLAL